MQELAAAIRSKVEAERQILERRAGEVTVDWVEVQAEIRHKAFQEADDLIANAILRAYGHRPGDADV